MARTRKAPKAPEFGAIQIDLFRWPFLLLALKKSAGKLMHPLGLFVDYLMYCESYCKHFRHLVPPGLRDEFYSGR